MAENEMLDAPSRVKLEIERGAALIADMSARGIEPKESAKIRKNNGLSLVERRALKRAGRREHAQVLRRSMEKKEQRLEELRANPKHEAAELKDLERKLAAEARVLETVLKRVRRGEVGMQGPLEELNDTAAGMAEKFKKPLEFFPNRRLSRSYALVGNDGERGSGKDGLHLRGGKGKGSKHKVKSKGNDGLSLEEKLENLQNSVNHKKKKLEILQSQNPIQAGVSKKLKMKLRGMTRELKKLRHDLGLRSTETIDVQIEKREDGREEVIGSPVVGEGNSLGESQILEKESGPVKLSLKERKLPKKPNKRKAIEGTEDTVNAGAEHAEEFAVGEAFLVGDISAKKEKKKRKKDKASRDSAKFQSIPAFRVAFENEQPASAQEFTGNDKAFFDTRTGRYIMQAAQNAPPTPQQDKQDASRATIVNAKSPSPRSPPADDRILEAVDSDVITSKSPAERCHDALVAVGRAATATPLRCRTDLTHSSTLDSTPTKTRRVYEGVRKSKPGRGERIEGEAKDWEFPLVHVEARAHAQGTDDGNIEEHIAFSSTHLTSFPRGILIGDTKFQVLQIVSGTELELPAHASKDGKGIKICSIAKGHIKVTVGSKTFDIGEGGVFRVRAGEKCVVINQPQSQGDAVVHVCTTRG
ncbi:hypothetical protein BUE80_DR009019 [Diplocarpon rosae]|nr:hypothetical protein BUE80_DR009019 [Diplocarpon rosae]